MARLSMNVYGSTCPMCCGDLDDAAYRRTGAAVCLSCGCHAGALASTPRAAQLPDATAFSLSATAMGDPAVTQAPPGWISPAPDIQVPAGASIARTK